MKLKNISEMPYYRTNVPVEKSKFDILSLLSKYDIHDYQWTRLDGEEILRFIITLEFDKIELEIEKRVAIELKIPDIYGLKSGGKIKVPEAQKFRFFYSSLKSLLEATTYGIMKKEDIFFSFMKIGINGRLTTVKDYILSNAHNLPLLE